MADDESDGFCSICLDPVGSDAVRILMHLLDEHAYHEEFTSFIAQVEFGVNCARCGRWFYSDVEPNKYRMFKARSVCPDHRDGAWARLRAETVDPRDLVKRGRRMSADA